nr:MAG TPA: hypothetical protein [Caudoviricetes sp.]
MSLGYIIPSRSIQLSISSINTCDICCIMLKKICSSTVINKLFSQSLFQFILKWQQYTI